MFYGGFLGMVPVVGLGQISPPPQGFYKLVELHDAAQASGDAELERYYEHLIEEHLEKQQASRQRSSPRYPVPVEFPSPSPYPLSPPYASPPYPTPSRPRNVPRRTNRSTPYRAPRIPTLPFGGSFWGGGAVTYAGM